MMTKKAFVAIVTCFNDDETINYEATRAQVRRQVTAGNNIMCAGTNGDFTALTHSEKIRILEEVVDEVGGKVDVIVNAGMPATFETLQLAKEFDRIGVKGIAVITPFFIACTQDGLIRHFSTVADEVNTPVYLYDIPARTQNHIEPETARKLATHGNIAGIKDSGGAQETLEASLLAGLKGGRWLRGLFRARSSRPLGTAKWSRGLHLRSRQRDARRSRRHRQWLQLWRYHVRRTPTVRLHSFPHRSLRPRLSSSHGQTRALFTGPLCRSQSAASITSRCRTGSKD